jgi:hypothetical protein
VSPLGSEHAAWLVERGLRSGDPAPRS